MAHRIDLCAKAVGSHPVAANVVSLSKASYALCSRSPLRSQLLEQNQVPLGLPQLVMLRDVATRWISHNAPLQRCLANLAPLLLTCADIQDGKAGKCTAAAHELLERLTNYSTLIAAAALQPLMLQLQLLIKALQVEDAYIVDLMDTVVATVEKIDCQYDSLTGFSGTDFVSYLRLTTHSHEKCALVETTNEQDAPLMAYRILGNNGHEVALFTMYAVMPSSGRSGRHARPRAFTKLEIPQIVQLVKSQVEKCVESVVVQLKERMSEPKLLRSLRIVFPQTFDSFDAEAFNDMVIVFLSILGLRSTTINHL
jgi:hypothetical protein